MDVRIPEYMIAIEEEGSLAKASERLHISSSALSQALSKLETELAAPLFLRSGGRWTPTEPGRIYLQGARELLSVKSEAYSRIERLARRQKKDIRFVICPQVYAFCHDALLSSFRRRLPGVRLELQKADSRQAAEYLLSDVSDVAILCSNGEGNSMLEYRALYREVPVLAVPRDLSWAGEEIDYDRVGTLPFILPGDGTFYFEIVTAALKEKGIAVNGAYRSESVEGIMRLVEHGYGMAMLPSRAAEITDCRTYVWPDAPDYTVYCATARYAAKKKDLPAVVDEICRCLREESEE